MNDIVRPPSLHVSMHPLVRHKRTLLSDKQTDSKTFRELVRELTRLVLYEATADIPTDSVTYSTPMEETVGDEISIKIGLVPILRAGLGMVDAAVDALPSAEVWHLGMYRDEKTHEPVSYYNRLPSRCPDDLIIVLDPMLATGGSAVDAVNVLKQWGATWIKFAGIIAAPEGARALHAAHPDVDIFVAALDRELDDDRFIRPGLGDAGDRLFGTHDT
ncbi:MAG TPA: uracil phosphoribosyltransferase [Thermomicrobiales bacterium]|nr:uracil phosphoribosyltransferase [Thermomicrobiales bacterium]